MTLEFYPAALEVFRKIKDIEPELAEKIKLLLKDVLDHPDSGVGTPVQLSGKYAGVWARKISFENTLYYVFNEEKVVALSIKLSSSHFATSTEVPTLASSGTIGHAMNCLGLYPIRYPTIPKPMHQMEG